MQKKSPPSSTVAELASAQEPDIDRLNEAFDLIMARYEEKVFTEFDRRTCSPQALRDFRALLRKRLLNEKPLPTVAEVDGIKELVLDFFHYHPDRPPLPYGLGQF